VRSQELQKVRWASQQGQLALLEKLLALPGVPLVMSPKELSVLPEQLQQEQLALPEKPLELPDVPLAI
jgi:hypothetical protein